MSAIRYFFPMFDRLEPTTEWCGGYMANIDVLTLEDAAKFASKHAGKEVTPSDFLRAAGRGQIRLKAIVHRTAKVQRHDGGIYCNKGQENENMAPAGAIAPLPQSACEHLAATGRASWRTFDGFELMDGVWCRYTEGLLVDVEPDFETSVADCRVEGREVHALADEFCDSPATQAANASDANSTSTDAGRLNEKKWTPEKLAELIAYRDAHTMKETAEKFQISQQRIRELLPRKKPNARPFDGLISRTR